MCPTDNAHGIKFGLFKSVAKFVISCLKKFKHKTTNKCHETEIILICYLLLFIKILRLTITTDQLKLCCYLMRCL